MDYTTPEAQATLKEQLKNEIVCVTFKKISGDFRTMQCTLMESRLPVRETSEKAARPAPTSSLAVFDVDADAFRSFRWDSITEVSVA